jgi:hypothetical protein
LDCAAAKGRDMGVQGRGWLLPEQFFAVKQNG